MDTLVLVIMVVLAVVEWVSVWKGWKMVRWVTKPGSLAALIVWFSLLGGWQGPLIWFGLALVFSLGGDVFLMFRKLFLVGLVSFLIGHICYIVGFNQTLPPLDLGSLAILVGLGIFALYFYRFVDRNLAQKPEARALRAPVFIYMIILTLMAFSAIVTLLRADWPMAAAILASFGGMLFMISDTTLAVERFVRPFAYSNVLVMVTYHLAQFSLAYAALVRYIPGLGG